MGQNRGHGALVVSPRIHGTLLHVTDTSWYRITKERGRRAPISCDVKPGLKFDHKRMTCNIWASKINWHNVFIGLRNRGLVVHRIMCITFEIKITRGVVYVVTNEISFRFLVNALVAAYDCDRKR